jgi:xylulokinase
MACLLGIDIGTSGTKAALLSDQGAVLGRGYSGYEPTLLPDGGAEQAPQDYLEAARCAVREALQQSNLDAGCVEGIGLSGLAPVCIFTREDFDPLGPAILWLDRRSAPVAEALRQHPLAERIRTQSGNPIDSFYGTVKLLHEIHTNPGRVAQARYVLTAVGHVLANLTGTAVMDHAHAALYGVAFDLRKRCWDSDILAALEIPQHLFPPLVEGEKVIGGLSSEGADLLGLKEGIPVVAGTVDGTAACLAAGAHRPGDAMMALGTSALFYVVHDTPKFSGRLIAMPYAGSPSPLYTSVGAMTCGGVLFKYAKDVFGSGLDYPDLEAEAAAIPAGCEGLTALPYFEGERTPIWQPQARGGLYGLTLSHGRGHIVRALLESVALGLRHHREILLEDGIKPGEPILIGEGGARSPLWCQIIADALQVRLERGGEMAGAEIGAAVLAGIGTGVIPSLETVRQWRPEAEPVEPNRDLAAAYDEAYRRYRSLERSFTTERLLRTLSPRVG